MKIRPVGYKLFHAVGRANGQTNMTKLIIAFRNFANAPENCMTNAVSLPRQFMFCMILAMKGHHFPTHYSMNGIILI
jgi:hypothetical protein